MQEMQKYLYDSTAVYLTVLIMLCVWYNWYIISNLLLNKYKIKKNIFHCIIQSVIFNLEKILSFLLKLIKTFIPSFKQNIYPKFQAPFLKTC